MKWFRRSTSPFVDKSAARVWAPRLSALAALILAAIAVVDHLGGDGKQRATGDVRLESAVVFNGLATYRNDNSPGGAQTLRTAPRVDLTLQNHGSARVLITQVRIDIEDYADLDLCLAQGGGPVPVSAHYSVHLPSKPLPSERSLTRPLVPPQEIGRGQPDRIQIRFGSALGTESQYQLYALRLRLKTNQGPDLLDAGRYVISTPEPVDRNGSYLPEDNSFLQGPPTFPAVDLRATWCYRRNLASVRRVIKRLGGRAPEVAALASVRPASRWHQAQDKTPPRAAARKLLVTRYADPSLAVAAAEQTKDQVFIARVRTRAAAKLLREGRRDLARGLFERAMGEARAALEVRDTPAGRSLLAGATRKSKASSSP